MGVCVWQSVEMTRNKSAAYKTGCQNGLCLACCECVVRRTLTLRPTKKSVAYNTGCQNGLCVSMV